MSDMPPSLISAYITVPYICLSLVQTRSRHPFLTTSSYTPIALGDEKNPGNEICPLGLDLGFLSSVVCQDFWGYPF